MSNLICNPPEEIREILKRVSKEKGVFPFPTSQKVVGQYSSLSAETYALCMVALRENYWMEKCFGQPLFDKGDKTKVVRPLSLREIIEARVIDYNTLKNPDGSERTKEDRLKLYDAWFDSCTGFAYQADSTKFKIIPVCKELIEIDQLFTQPFLAVDYNKLNGFELSFDTEKYNRTLLFEETLKNPGWLAVVEEDKNLLKEYMEIIFTEFKMDRMASFFVKNNTNVFLDWLRVAYIDCGDNSYVGHYDLHRHSRFIKVV